MTLSNPDGHGKTQPDAVALFPLPIDCHEATFDFRFQRLVEPSWQNTLFVLVVLTVAMSLLAISANTAVLLTLLGVGMLIGGVLIVWMLSKAKVVTNRVDDLELTTRIGDLDSKRSD